MEKKLQVRDLRISFRTSNGKVQAVRGINFDLDKGETIAIVGESGSGKSVTSKAILGILANNAIIEGGEIIYDGKDLLKISEDEFHKIRGDKIAMIFQDPMSSLNPIVKIGRQLTEAMILKGKARQKESRRGFHSFMSLLEKAMIDARGKDAAPAVKKQCAAFIKTEMKHLELEYDFNQAYEAATEAVNEATTLAFEVGHGACRDLSYRVRRTARLCDESVQRYVVYDRREELWACTRQMRDQISSAMQGRGDALKSALETAAEILREAVAYEKPDFFAMAYYQTVETGSLPEMDVAELNAFLRRKLHEEFMDEFLNSVEAGLRCSANAAYDRKMDAVSFLQKNRAAFEAEDLKKSDCIKVAKAMVASVEKGIDSLEYIKDSRAYTFDSVLKNNIELYFGGIIKNGVEERRFAKQNDRYQALVKKGKTPEWHVVPKSLINLEHAKKDIVRSVDNMIARYEEKLAGREQRDYRQEAVDMIGYLQEVASGIINKVTKDMARERAIKLMNEVGIPDARKRYNQYPFEFSGGMRQRIVIAIALAANPDILICDEPTTALDVTIQAQILELIQDLKRKRNLSVIFITHDLGVVANMADRIAVMYAGKIVECGTAEEVFYNPAHPYTWALLSSMPDLDSKDKLEAIPGTPPDMIYPPVGDAFAERNRYAMQIDFEQQPPEFPITPTHWAATWLLHPEAPKVDPPKTVTNRIAKMKARMEAEKHA